MRALEAAGVRGLSATLLPYESPKAESVEGLYLLDPPPGPSGLGGYSVFATPGTLELWRQFPPTPNAPARHNSN